MTNDSASLEKKIEDQKCWLAKSRKLVLCLENCFIKFDYYY